MSMTMKKKNDIVVSGLRGQLTPEGWLPPTQPLSYQDWTREFGKMLQARRAVQFAVGDLLNFGEEMFGGAFAQILDEKNMSPQRLATYKWVASAFPFSTRRQELSWTHHKHLSSIPDSDRQDIADLVISRGWSVNETYFYVSAWRALYEHGMNTDDSEAWAAHAIAHGWTVPTMKKHIVLSRKEVVLDAISDHDYANSDMDQTRPAAFVLPAGDAATPIIESGQNVVLRLFFDVEVGWDSPIAHVISIGIRTEWGDEFYAEMTNVDWSRIDDMAKEEILPFLRLGKSLGRVIDPSTARWDVVGDSDFVCTELLQWANNCAAGAEWEIWMDMPTITWPAFVAHCDKSSIKIKLPDSPLDVSTLLWTKGRNYKMSREEWGGEPGRRDALSRANVVYRVWKFGSR